MLCYLGRTFCNNPDCQGRCGCPVWTPELQAGADRWWATFNEPGPAPVSFLEHTDGRAV